MMMCLKKLRCSDWIQICILLVLLINLFYFWLQYRSTQLLNKPLCAVKQLNVDPALEGKNIIKNEICDKSAKDRPTIKIAAVIKNFGKYAAKKVSITWNMVLLKGEKDAGQFKRWVEVERRQESMIATDLTILPEHEFEQWLQFFYKEDLDKIVSGWEKAVDINISIKYLNKDNKTEIYDCTYRITKMLITEIYLYEVSLIRSST